MTRARRRVAVATGLVLATGASVALAGQIDEHAAALPAVVTVSSPAPTGAAQVATGFAVGPERVVTVAHVLERGRRLLVRTADGRVRRASIVRVDRRDDLALLAVPGLAAQPPHTVAGRAEPARM